MAGPATARRGEKKSPSGPPSAAAPPGRRFRWQRLPFRAPSRRGLIIILVVAVLLGAFGVWALYASNWLRVERVSITGTKVLTPHEVVAAADAPMNAPLASVDTDALDHAAARTAAAHQGRGRRAVLAEHNRPEGDRKGAGTAAAIGRKVCRSGCRGRPVRHRPHGPRGVPLLEMAVSDSPSLHRFGIDRLRRAAVKVAQDLPTVVRKDVRKVRVRSYDAITLELAERPHGRVGQPRTGRREGKGADRAAESGT